MPIGKVPTMVQFGKTHIAKTDTTPKAKVLDVCVDFYVPQLSNNRLFMTQKFQPRLAREARSSYVTGREAEMITFDDLHLAASTFLEDRAEVPVEDILRQIKDGGEILGYAGGQGEDSASVVVLKATRELMEDPRLVDVLRDHAINSARSFKTNHNRHHTFWIVDEHTMDAQVDGLVRALEERVSKDVKNYQLREEHAPSFGGVHTPVSLAEESHMFAEDHAQRNGHRSKIRMAGSEA